MSIPPPILKRIAPMAPSVVGTQQKWPDPLPPADGLRLQRTLSLPADLGTQQIETVVRDCIAELDGTYRHIGGSGLGCESICLFRAEEGPNAVQLALYPRAAGEDIYLEVLSELIEDLTRPPLDLSKVPIGGSAEDDISLERIEYLRRTQPGDLSDMIAHIKSLMGK